MSKQFYIKQFSLVQFGTVKTVPFQTIQFSISTQFEHKLSLIVKIFLFQAIQFSQTVLIQIIQFSKSMQLVLFNLWIGPN